MRGDINLELLSQTEAQANLQRQTHKQATVDKKDRNWKRWSRNEL